MLFDFKQFLRPQHPDRRLLFLSHQRLFLILINTRFYAKSLLYYFQNHHFRSILVHSFQRNFFAAFVGIISAHNRTQEVKPMKADFYIFVQPYKYQMRSNFLLHQANRSNCEEVRLRLTIDRCHLCVVADGDQSIFYCLISVLLHLQWNNNKCML